jgi:ABC-type multidrug transport system fused ATPase/permease subunit
VTSTRLLARLIRECLRYPIMLILAMISLIGLGGAQLALPWLVKLWVEGPIVDGGEDLGGLISAALAVVGMAAVFLFTSCVLLASINQRMLERLRTGAVRRIMRMEPEGAQSLATGDVMSRVFQDAGMLSGFVELVLKRFLGDGILATGALVMMFVIDPVLAALACLMAPVIGLVLAAIGGVIRRWGRVAQEEMGELSGTLQEQLQGFTTIKSYLTEAHEAEKFSSLNASYRHKVVVAEGWSALLVGAVFLLAALGFIAAVAYGSRQIGAGAITAGGLLAFCLYAGQTVEPLRRLAEIHGHLQRSLAAAERLFLLFEMPTVDGESSPSGSGEAKSLGGAGITLEDVHFRYNDGVRVLDRICLDIGAGGRVAVVAASGGGKSTLGSLMVRFHDPKEGRILIDGVDLRNLPRAEIRRLVKVVEQRPFLFSGPLIDNIRYGSPSATPTDVAKAIRMAGMEPWIAADPRGLDAPLGEAGREVSGGQRQRVALARAILSDPEVLVLDEATSALDSEAETQILEDMEAWMAQRTVIVMAHRLSTIRRIPRIVVLEDGRVIDEGSLDELLGRSEVFRTLFAEQLEGA